MTDVLSQLEANMRYRGFAPMTVPTPDIESDKELNALQWSVLASFCLQGDNSVNDICRMLFKTEGIADAINYLHEHGYLTRTVWVMNHGVGMFGKWALTPAGRESRDRWYDEYRYSKDWGSGQGWGAKSLYDSMKETEGDASGRRIIRRRRVRR